MKLARITKPLRSVQVRVMLTGDITANLERYAQYYGTFTATPWTLGRSFRRSSAPSSTPTVNSSRGRGPLRPGHTAPLLRLRPTTAPRRRRDLP